MPKRFDQLDKDAREKLSKTEMPSEVNPMLATLTDDHFSDPDGLFERKTAPVVDASKARNGGARWVSPELVAEIGFTEWTTDNRLRHPKYMGLRGDKSPRDVLKEEPGARS